MAQPNEELHRLIEKRGRLKSNLTRFKSFYDAHQESSSTDVFEQRLNQSLGLIDKFEALQKRIEILVLNTINEEAHLQFRENFETTYDELVGEVCGCITPSRRRGQAREHVHT